VADTPVFGVEQNSHPVVGLGRSESSPFSIREFVGVIRRRRGIFFGTVIGLLLLCLLYCLIAPNQYEASAKVALRMQPASSLTLGAAEAIAPASILSTPLQLETLANVLRSEQLAWRVITGMKLYESAGFSRNFAKRFAAFDPKKPTPEAQSYLLDLFAKRLHVRSMPRTLLLEIRFRSRDPALAARVVDALIQGFETQEGESRVGATKEGSDWLRGQLKTLTAEVEGKEKRLAEFERKHGFMTTQQTMPGGLPVETLHDSTVQEVDEAERSWAEAIGDRILHEALYREAQHGNPEQVLAANPELQAQMGPGGAAQIQQLRTRLSDVQVELAQLKIEHGANFPRVVELERVGADIEAQIQVQDANLIEAFARTWKTAASREAMLRQQLDARMAEGLGQNDATVEYAVLHEEVLSGRELCTRVERRIEEAALSAGVHASSIEMVDSAREPFKPVAPDLPLYLAITLFLSLWIALGAVFLMEAVRPEVGGSNPGAQGAAAKSLAICVVLILAASPLSGQAPTPNTQGLPSGVVKLPQDQPVGLRPDAKSAPPVWSSAVPATAQEAPEQGGRSSGMSMVLPIGVGDFLEVSEFHTPEFRSAVRVAADGTVLLPLVGQVKLQGMTEQQASLAIEKAFVDGGMLLHPQVSVLVTNAAGQDVSVMGEVTRPGVYPFTAHHRLLDLIAAASGLSSNAGRLVSVFHREDAQRGHPVVLDPSGSDAKVDHNPELEPGDTVLVSRAGLVYVIGDVIRPGGFAVDPVQGLTVVQALSLAWGATPNASVSKAILIRDQPGGRTLTTLNLRRMIRGQDPDQPVRDRDILFIPDSAAKNLMNKSLESAIQSAIGVSIYAGLVYSQRF
jgi:polysaccharide export outer membrane protein